MLGLAEGAYESPLKFEMPKETYGAIHAFWGYSSTAADSNLTTSLWTHMVVVGTFKGKGRYATLALAANMTPSADTNEFDDTNYCDTTTGSTTLGQCLVSAPVGGVAQFKGLTQGAAEDKYVQVTCHGVQPYYYGTLWHTITAASNGFVLTCMTGISQCAATNDHAVAEAPLSAAERATCLADPRYLTWRMMTLKVNYKGGLQWYRTDSYWDGGSFQAASTWGPGLKLSTHITSNNDNNGLTDLGKTYVFAMGDGSGVTLHHLAFSGGVAASISPTDFTTPGTGANVFVTERSKSYTTKFPDQYSMDFCSETNLEIAGSATTEGFVDAVAAFTDGYYMKSTMAMHQQHAGGVDSWTGTCVLYYSSEYVQDNTHGSVCHVVTHDASTTAGPTDFGSSILIHVTSATWYPPQKEGSVTPSGNLVQGDKYGLVALPAAVTGHVLRAGYYASVKWYQPVSASDYIAVARYGRGDRVAAYCMQGQGSTSYFQQHGTPVTLASGMALIAGTSLLYSTMIAL